MKNVYLFQPQYTSLTKTGQQNCWIPYSVGCIWSYALQFEDIQQNFQLGGFFFRRDPFEKVLAQLDNPAVCGFSLYMWNKKYCIELAQVIKEKWPNCLIIFGGPQVNGKLLTHSFIDSIVTGEGEENFVRALQNIIYDRPTELIYDKKRLDQLDIPSPYTTGIFDAMLKDNPNVIWNMTFETNRGCPYACTFCDWGSLTYSKVKKFDLDHVRADLEWCVGRPVNYLFCADANFGIFKERDLEIARIIRSVGDRCNLDTINLIYAKNSTEIVFQIAQIVGDLNRGITVSVQSENPETLEAIKRKNLESNNIKKLMELSEHYDIPTYTEVILGLPLETLSTWKQGMCHILELGQHNSIDVWFTQLIENSELNSDASRKKYGISSVVANDFMPHYDPTTVDPVVEDFELINATNTMSTVEMVEAYMWTWMIIHFHLTGYTQIVAKYYHNVHQISYYDFYQRLFDHVKSHAVFKDHYAKVESLVSNYLNYGRVPVDEETAGHTLHAVSYSYMYKNKELIYQLAQEVCESFGNFDSTVNEIQKLFVIDDNVSYPVQLNTNYNINTWQKESSTYKIESRVASIKDVHLYRQRRQGLTKNKITKII